MKSNYNDALNRVLKSEGGYTNDPRDPGGPTNFGITIADYRAYINKNGTASDVKKMTVEQAKAIYKPKYWDKVNGDNLPSGVDYSVFDYGVNSGVNRANRVYKQVVQPDSIKTINAINDERLRFLHGLSTWNHFGKGWSSRVSSVRQHSIDLANKPVGHNTAAGAVVAAGTAATTVAVTHPNYWPYIIAGVVIAAIITWLVVKYKKGK
jgi:lysozyme family protein